MSVATASHASVQLGTKPKLSFLCLLEYLRHVLHFRHISLMAAETPGQKKADLALANVLDTPMCDL